MARLARQAVREVDHQAIEEFGVPGVVLMENAGANAARLLAGLGITGPIAIACGRGNNGGDGLVMARHLDAAGYTVRLLLAAPTAAYAGDAAVNLRICDRSGLTIEHLADADEPAWRHALAGACWIVDALLGTGAVGPPRGGVAAAISAINAVRAVAGTAAVRVFAVDLPSGLDADSGVAAGDCVRADVTATFVAEKTGFVQAAAFTGHVHVLGIGAPRRLLRRFGISP